MIAWIVEDQKDVCGFLSGLLKSKGFLVVEITTFEELEAQVSEGVPAPDIVILDRILQKTDATAKLIDIKNTFLKSRVIILSAIGNASERSHWIDLGADDYLNKPFSGEELLSRIKRLLRETLKGDCQTPVAQVGDATIDEAQHEIRVRGEKLSLQNKEYLVAKLLLEHPREVFNRYRILDAVWGIQSDIESNVVESTINKLRRKLEDSGSVVRLCSKRNVGYWIEI